MLLLLGRPHRAEARLAIRGSSRRVGVVHVDHVLRRYRRTRDQDRARVGVDDLAHERLVDRRERRRLSAADGAARERLKLHRRGLKDRKIVHGPRATCQVLASSPRCCDGDDIQRALELDDVDEVVRDRDVELRAARTEPREHRLDVEAPVQRNEQPSDAQEDRARVRELGRRVRRKRERAIGAGLGIEAQNRGDLRARDDDVAEAQRHAVAAGIRRAAALDRHLFPIHFVAFFLVDLDAVDAAGRVAARRLRHDRERHRYRRGDGRRHQPFESHRAAFFRAKSGHRFISGPAR